MCAYNNNNNNIHEFDFPKKIEFFLYLSKMEYLLSLESGNFLRKLL